MGHTAPARRRPERGNDARMNASPTPPPMLLELASRMVPRYTSYPTAPHFEAGIGPDSYAAWLAEAKHSAEPVSIYLHIPFCRTICSYCGCTTRAGRGDDPIRTYAALLRREIALVAERLGPVQVAHIHWGGGTPSLLPPDWFEAIVRDLSDAFRFCADMEHAIDIDPRHLTPERARHLAHIGINRASLGVQTLDPAVQVAIRRVQPSPLVAGAAAMLRAAGIHTLNFDLMYGLPFQTLDPAQDTARQVLALRPNRLALFGYAHVPWMKSHQKLIDPASLPDGRERLLQAQAVREILEGSGYRGIGIDRFAELGDTLTEALASRRLHRNFQGYTTDSAATVIGFGASAIGRTEAGFVQNAADNQAGAGRSRPCVCRPSAARRLPATTSPVPLPSSGFSATSPSIWERPRPSTAHRRRSLAMPWATWPRWSRPAGSASTTPASSSARTGRSWHGWWRAPSAPIWLGAADIRWRSEP